MSTPEVEPMTNVHYAETRYGFEYGAAAVERMWNYRGYVCLRVVCRSTGEYVDLQVSPKGRRIHVHAGNEKQG